MLLPLASGRVLAHGLEGLAAAADSGVLGGSWGLEDVAPFVPSSSGGG